MNTVASLPMYDFPEIRWATDALWQGIARHLRRHGVDGIPSRLVHDVPLKDLWSDRRLIFSQCCGYDIVHRYRDRLQILATPTYTATGCDRGQYASAVVVPQASSYDDVLDMAGKVAVINGPESHSGTSALFGLVGPLARDGRFFSEIIISGGHAQSLRILQRGEADVAAIDCATLALLTRYRPVAVEGLRRLGLTYSAPAPPYVTNADVAADVMETMKTALADVNADESLDRTRAVLFIDRFEFVPGESYETIKAGFHHSIILSNAKPL